ncbi:hypothetical protein [Arenivirga flava]|uniref:Uncharacterized protein n=1 Tax=Arenivirga flava TaxID=1930060 RepID=A0AA37XCE4_9MICO|nr:hypothetical protein [Arenivirga flava]GMA29760.1 hypothetical protein GCM10025874_30130 [Arenivirga flava]
MTRRSSSPSSGAEGLWDPLSRMDGGSFVVTGAVWAFGFVVVMTFAGARQIDVPLLAAVAVVTGGAALGVLVHATRPGAPVVTTGRHLVIVALALAAAALAAAAGWSCNSSLRDDWGPVLVGVVTMLLAMHRPPRELVVVGVGAGLLIGAVTVGQVLASGADHRQPLVALALQTLVPAIAPPLGGAAFGSSLIAALARWRARSSSEHRAEVAGLDAGIARSVQQGHVSLLNAAAVPFLSGLLEREEVRPQDRAEADRVAASVRRHLLHDADRTWLDVLLAENGGAPLDDPGRPAAAVPEEERAVLRALMRLLVEQPEYEAGSLAATVVPRGEGFAVRVTATAHTSEQRIQHAAAPYLAALRSRGADVHLDLDAPRVAVQLNHGGG